MYFEGQTRQLGLCMGFPEMREKEGSVMIPGLLI